MNDANNRQPARSGGSRRGGRSRGGSGGQRSNASRAGSSSRGPRPNQSQNRNRQPAPRPPVVAAPAPVVVPRGALVEEVEIRANRRRARILCLLAGLGPALVLGVVLAVAINIIIGLAVFVVVTALVGASVWRISTQIALRLVGAHDVEPGQHPRLVNLVEGLCATYGLRPPKLMVTTDPVPNACALGRDPAEAVLVVTTGLLDHFGLIEMEGLIAHELAHVKRLDTAVSGVAVTVLAPLASLTGSDDLLHAAVGRGREYRADQIAASAVRYPPGLHDALAALNHSPQAGADSIFAPRRLALTRWLWINPLAARESSIVGDLDATEVRIAALAER